MKIIPLEYIDTVELIYFVFYFYGNNILVCCLPFTTGELIKAGKTYCTVVSIG